MRFGQQGDTAGHVMVKAVQAFNDPRRSKDQAAVLGLPSNASREEILATAATRHGYEDSRQLKRDLLEPVARAVVEDVMAVRAVIHDEERERASGADAAVPDISAAQRAEMQDRDARRNQIISQLARAEQAQVGSLESAKATLYHPSSDMQADIARAMAAHSGEVNPVAVNSQGHRRWKASTDQAEATETALRLENIRAAAQAEKDAAEARREATFRSPTEAAFAVDSGLSTEEARKHIPPDGFGGEFEEE